MTPADLFQHSSSDGDIKRDAKQSSAGDFDRLLPIEGSFALRSGWKGNRDRGAQSERGAHVDVAAVCVRDRFHDR
jgi:hypothetical protein